MLKSQKGLTLIEVLVANIFVIIGIMSVFCMLTIASLQLINSNGNTVATYLASEKMEELSHARYDKVISSEDFYGDIDKFHEFRRIVTVKENDPVVGVKSVRVAVVWRRLSEGEESTGDGLDYDPANPDLHRSLVEFVLLKEAYSNE